MKELLSEVNFKSTEDKNNNCKWCIHFTSLEESVNDPLEPEDIGFCNNPMLMRIYSDLFVGKSYMSSEYVDDSKELTVCDNFKNT